MGSSYMKVRVKAIDVFINAKSNAVEYTFLEYNLPRATKPAHDSVLAKARTELRLF